MRRPLLALAVSVLALTSACGTLSVDKEDLAQRTSTVLQQKVGQKPDKVSCPEDLEGKKGATTQCTLTDAGTSYPVDVVVTSVDGSDVKFSVKVGQAKS